MPEIPYRSLLSGAGTFAICIAPPLVLKQALSTFLARPPGLTLYLCGNYPAILPSLSRYCDSFEVRRALTAYQVLTILDEAYHTYVLFEHDRSLYEDGKDLLSPIGERCREIGTGTGTVFLLATRPDTSLYTLESHADKILYLRDVTAAKPRAKTQDRRYRQEKLEGVW